MRACELSTQNNKKKLKCPIIKFFEATKFPSYDHMNNFQILAHVLSNMLNMISLFLGFQQALNLIQIGLGLWKSARIYGLQWVVVLNNSFQASNLYLIRPLSY